MPDRVSIVALPIGCVEDLSPRARAALEACDLLFCEDTQKARDFLRRAEINFPPKFFSLPGDREHTIHWDRFEGKRWALVSDAGTPVLNDPGRSLCRWALEQNISLQAIPGPSAPVAAWQWCGGFGLPFYFAGFAPKASPRAQKKWEQFFALAEFVGSFCYFDTRHQVLQTLRFLSKSRWASKSIFIAREVTKKHEELLSGKADELMEILSSRVDSGEGVGELTFILEGGGNKVLRQDLDWKQLLKIRQVAPKEAAKIIAQLSGEKSRRIYQEILQTSEDP